MDKIQEIFTAPWAIADNDYYRLLSLLVPCVAAGNLDAIEKRLDNNKITAYATTPYLADRWELDDDTLPVDSVAVIILEGTLYSWETYRLEKQLRDIDSPVRPHHQFQYLRRGPVDQRSGRHGCACGPGS